jgi:hypothetical protein
VYAIGNPNGLSKTLTAGVVSGLNRTIPAPTGTRIYGAIQVCHEFMEYRQNRHAVSRQGLLTQQGYFQVVADQSVSSSG